jgi:hypothetical protein
MIQATEVEAGVVETYVVDFERINYSKGETRPAATSISPPN